MRPKATLESLARRTEELKAEAEAASQAVAAAIETTAKLLTYCSDRGMDRVAIGTTDESVPVSKGWPFGADNCLFVCNAKGKYQDKETGWPVAWGAAQDVLKDFGYGNSGQAGTNVANLVEGVYHFRGGKWYRKEA